MTVDTSAILSVTEANRNFSRAAHLAESKGEIILFKNNRPKFLLIDMDSSSYVDLTDDEKIDVVAARILKKFKPAFEELAK